MSMLHCCATLITNQKASLDVQEAGVDQRGDVTIHDISYASPKGGDPSQSG
jgi:hypothetical protein